MNNSNISRFGSPLSGHVVSILVIIVVFLTGAATVFAQEEATVYVDVIKSGAPQPVDTIFANGHYEFRIWGALNYISGGVSLVNFF